MIFGVFVIFDACERVGHHLTHEIVCLVPRIIIVIRQRLLYRRFVAVSFYYVHLHVIKLVKLLLVRRLLGCACSDLNVVWLHSWDLDYPLLVIELVLFDLKATELFAHYAIDFLVDFLTYGIFLVPGAYRN